MHGLKVVSVMKQFNHHLRGLIREEWGVAFTTNIPTILKTVILRKLKVNDP